MDLLKAFAEYIRTNISSTSFIMGRTIFAGSIPSTKPEDSIFVVVQEVSPGSTNEGNIRVKQFTIKIFSKYYETGSNLGDEIDLFLSNSHGVVMDDFEILSIIGTAFYYTGNEATTKREVFVGNYAMRWKL